MTLNASKVDLVLQYALLLAGEEDGLYERQLGPIHLIKYVYIADLAFAKHNHGATFTGAPWRFYKFGPWAESVHARIEPALYSINAERAVFESDFADRDDWVRWSKRDSDALKGIEAALPFEIRMELRRDVHRFGKDTASLLDFVYKTMPMLSAAPNEPLDFSLEPAFVPRKKDDTTTPEPLSRRQEKKFHERLRDLRNERSKRPNPAPKLIRPPEPRYDDVFASGTEWLNGLAGKAFEERAVTAEFSDEVWKSDTRKGHEIP